MTEIKKTGENQHIPGDVSQNFIVGTDLTVSIAGNLKDSASAMEGYLRQMRKEELGLKSTGHSASKTVPHSQTAEKVTPPMKKALMAPTKETEGTVLKGHPSKEPSKKGKRH